MYYKIVNSHQCSLIASKLQHKLAAILISFSVVDAPSSDQEDLFIKKLKQGSVVFNFMEATENIKVKVEIKLTS